MRALPTLTTTLVLFGLALGASVATAAAQGAGQANCDWYGRTALRQQQENERRKCGFAGASWSADLGTHLKWCSGVAPSTFLAEAQKRDAQLATACGKR